jgi:hypothetical protein|tara:strand:- start:1 stop:1161 length:1161 start_codon:yes stop_codon:yes gene_type:complete
MASPRAFVVLAILFAVYSGPALGQGPRQGIKTPLPPPDFEIRNGGLDPGRPGRPVGEPYSGPIYDTHVHVFNRDSAGVSDILAWMDKTGVERLLVLPTPNEGIFRDGEMNAGDRRRWPEMAGDRGGRLCGSTYLTNWMHDAYNNGYDPADLERRLKRLEKDLDDGGCLGVGEIGPYHFDKKGHGGIITFPLNFEPMLAVAGVAARKGVPLDIHAEPNAKGGGSYEEKLYGGFALLYQRYPNLKLILAHTGMTNPVNARRLLETYPNMMMNMKWVGGRGELKWGHLGPIINADRNLYEDWAKLFEDMPDRFMVGTDSRFGTRQYQGRRYGKNIKVTRRLLGSLDPKAAAMIAHGNARRIFGETTHKVPDQPAADKKGGRKKKRKKRR